MAKVLVACPAYRLWARSYLAGLRLEWDGLLPIVYLMRDNEGALGDLLVRKWNAARQMVLDGGYDALLCLEDDVVPPADGLRKLYEVDADIVYGLYPERHGSYRWLAYTHLTPNGGRSLSKDPDRARASWGQVIDCAGVGMGFTLVRRSFLEAVQFRMGHHAAPDWWMAVDAQRGGFSQKCHTGVLCGHITPGPGATVLYCDPDAPGLVRKEAL